MFRIHSFPNNDTSNSSTQLHLPLLKTTYHNCLMNYLSISNVGLAAGLMLWMLNPKSSLILFLHLASFNSIVQQLALIPFTLHRHACSRMPGQYTTSVMNMQPMHSDQQSFFGGRLIGCKRAFNIAIFWSRDLAGTWKSINLRPKRERVINQVSTCALKPGDFVNASNFGNSGIVTCVRSAFAP